MDTVSALSGTRSPAGQNLPPRLERAIGAAKAVAERRIPAASEDKLTETYHQISGGKDAPQTDTRVQLDVDDATGRVIGRVVDKSSGEIVHQLPSPEMLELIAKAKELFGDLVNEKV